MKLKILLFTYERERELEYQNQIACNFAGERIANMRQAFNIREGLNPLQFKVPGRAYGNPPPEKGPLAGITVDEETLDSEFLAAMDWNLKTAKPSKKKMLELGLEDVAQELWL